MYENNDRPSLPQLPKRKNKEKWEKILWQQTKLLL